MKAIAFLAFIVPVSLAGAALASPSGDHTSGAMGKLALTTSNWSHDDDRFRDGNHFREGDGDDHDYGRGRDHHPDHHHGNGHGPDCDRGESWHSRNCPASP
jgi:hypothetical protein